MSADRSPAAGPGAVAPAAASSPSPAPAAITAPPAPRSAALAALTALVDRLGREPAAAAPWHAGAAPSALPHLGAPAGPLRAVAAHQRTWSRLRAEQRLRQAGAQVPAQAGPLNSQQVVHRTLQALHTLAPAYLEALLASVDTLLALEQASGGGLTRPRPPRSPRPGPPAPSPPT